MKLLVWNNHLRPPTQNIVKVGADLLSLEFDNKIVSWWAADRPWLYHFLKDENQVFCSELVAMVLQRLTVLQKSKVPAWYSPGNFFDRRELQLEEGYSYGVKHFFQFPLDETLDIMTHSQPISTGLGNIHIPQLQEEV